MAAFNAVNELFLPALKAAIARPAQVDRDEDGWELTPPAEDSTLSLPRTLAHETTVGRLCELGPKVWLLCVHCAVLVGSCFAIAEKQISAPLAHACLAFSAWSVLWLGSGVIESVARRHIWLRLLENGILLQPKPAGTIIDRCGSPEYRVLCCGFGLMGLLHLSVLGVEGLGLAELVFRSGQMCDCGFRANGGSPRRASVLALPARMNLSARTRSAA